LRETRSGELFSNRRGNIPTSRQGAAGVSERRPQNLSNHARLDEWFHFFIIPILLLNFIFAIYSLVRHPGYVQGWIALVSFTLLAMAFKMRIYSLKVQSRLIRLEEHLRLASLLPEPLRTRIAELSEDQLIGLRFASDGELADLVDRTLAEGLNRKQIKQAVKEWRPDYWRV
jgi:hypothetical protein